MKILMHYFIFFFLVILSFGQVKDPETGELVNLKYDKKSGSYYLFGLDKMELLDNKFFQGNLWVHQIVWCFLKLNWMVERF